MLNWNAFRFILSPVVETYAENLRKISDAELDIPWKWMDYDEGIRFSFFRVYEILRQLGVELRMERIRQKRFPSSVQLILVQYYIAYWHLRGILLDVNDRYLDQEPAPGEWPLRKILSHIIESEWTFFGTITYALQQQPEPGEPRLAPPEDYWDTFFTREGNYKKDTFSGSLGTMINFFDQQNQRIIENLTKITEEQLDWTIPFWESTPMTLRFRLHRFESHCRQHSIQIQKCLSAVGFKRSETLYLLQLIYAGMAEVDGGLIGAENLGEDLQRRAADQIIEITSNINQILQHKRQS